MRDIAPAMYYPALMVPNDLLRRMFDAAVAAAQPELCVPAHLPSPPKGRTIVVGAGKAAAAMARALERHWQGPLEGLVITRYGHAMPCEQIEIVEAGHPVPDAPGRNAAQRILDLVSDLTEDDLVIALISGGGSSLLTLPAPGLTLADKQAVNAALLQSGAPIDAMNCVRKHLSAIKGGRLARAAAPARLEALIISDVPGDDPAIIASGPTVPDPTTFADARAVIESYAITLPAAVQAHLATGADESPKPGDPCFANVGLHLIATPSMALAAAADIAQDAGYAVDLLGDAIEGEARAVAAEHARRARNAAPGTIILSGGELTVTLTGNGRGGPNTEYALALSLALDGAAGIHAMACDTDGIDGSEDNAGAHLGPDTLERAAAASVDPNAALAANDSYGVFAALGDLVVTGPTHTNVNDFRTILIER
ncbi:MAG: glycerate 2-kinase [Alphaproteobacteria bacterium]